MATQHGAEVVGNDRIGVLAVGKEADCIAVSMDDIEMLPVYDPICQLVYAGSREQVTDVWIAGKQVMENRRLLTIDIDAVKANTRQWGRKIQGIS